MHRKLLLPCLLWICGSALAAPKQPNILFIFSDDHAVEAISAYSGGRLNNTPNIDRLAKEGMLFENSFCANSICGPSRACILTGKHSHINGFIDNEGARFDGSQMTYPKLLQKAGYQTAIVGKWHLVTDPTGFDYWEILPGQGSYYNPHFIQMDGTRLQRPGYCTDIVTDRALKWLDERKKDKPFLLMCQHKSPHRNWAPPPRHLTLFDDRSLPLPDTLRDNYSGRSKLLGENKMSIANHFYWGHDMKFHGQNQFPEYFLDGIPNGEYRRMTPAQKARWDAAYEPKNQRFISAVSSGRFSSNQVLEWKYQRYIKDYLRTVQAMDDGIGRVLDYLDATGLNENTIVVYASDQGFYLGEHGWYDKRWMFEESFKMPLLVRWPGEIEPGSRSRALVQNIDYAPTFLEMAGVDVPREIQGTSLMPVLKNRGYAPQKWRDSLYYAYYGERTHNVAAHDGVRTMQHKLVYFPRTKEWQLFDLIKDPSEMRSVHQEASYAATLKNMRKRYTELRKKYKVNTATIPKSRNREDWWQKRYRAKNQQTKNGPGRLIFVGDSITQGWEGGGREVWDSYYKNREAVNLGFSGDRTEHAIWRLEKGNLNGIKDAKLGVIMIGTNNTGHLQQAPEETADGVKRVVEMFRKRCPEAKVLLLGVFPRSEKPDDPMRRINAGINNIISKLHDGETVHYLDIGETFLASDGQLGKSVMPDYLHLSKQGYEMWAEAIENHIVKLGGGEK